MELKAAIAQLSPEDRDEILDFVLDLDEGLAADCAQGREVEWPDMLARARQIFGDRTLPNLVLQERETYKY